MHPEARVAGTLLAVIFGGFWPPIILGACCPPPGTDVVVVPKRRDPRLRGLPDDRDALLKLSDALTTAPLDAARLDRALAALQKAGGLRDGFDVRWRRARACFLITEVQADRHVQLRYARMGLRDAREAVALDGARVEGHYYLATNLGRIAETRGDLALLKPMIAAAERARAIDERFDHAGPLVYLGKLYLTAPPWPVSVGSPPKAIKLLQRAVIIAPRPLTRVFLGEAYFEDEQYKRAIEQLERALEQRDALPPRWRKEAESYLKRARAEQSAREPAAPSRPSRRSANGARGARCEVGA